MTKTWGFTAFGHGTGLSSDPLLLASSLPFSIQGFAKEYFQDHSELDGSGLLPKPGCHLACLHGD